MIQLVSLYQYTANPNLKSRLRREIISGRPLMDLMAICGYASDEILKKQLRLTIMSRISELSLNEVAELYKLSSDETLKGQLRFETLSRFRIKIKKMFEDICIRKKAFFGHFNEDDVFHDVYIGFQEHKTLDKYRFDGGRKLTTYILNLIDWELKRILKKQSAAREMTASEKMENYAKDKVKSHAIHFFPDKQMLHLDAPAKKDGTPLKNFINCTPFIEDYIIKREIFLAVIANAKKHIKHIDFIMDYYISGVAWKSVRELSDLYGFQNRHVGESILASFKRKYGAKLIKLYSITRNSL